MNMALPKNRPDFLRGIAILEERMFRWCTLHDKECLDHGIVDFPMAMCAWFELRIGNGEHAIEV